MRIAVATIALNEEKHVEAWYESAKDADVLLIADTGSTDATVEAAMDLGIVFRSILVRPWRFDVGRNTCLALLPENLDAVITLDMDEVLVPGWRDALEAAPKADRYTYDYVWNWTEDGRPDIRFHGDRCHSRFGYQWKGIIHEVLMRTDQRPESKQHGGFAIHHHADDSKPRTHYLQLLEQAVQENPGDDRIAHYYARELCFVGDWVRARGEFLRHLAMPTAVWPAERAQSYRYLAKMDDYPERWLLKAIAEDPNRREAWVDLASWYEQHGLMTEAQGAISRALMIRNRPTDYMTEAVAWDDEHLRLQFSANRLGL